MSEKVIGLGNRPTAITVTAILGLIWVVGSSVILIRALLIPGLSENYSPFMMGFDVLKLCYWLAVFCGYWFMRGWAVALGLVGAFISGVMLVPGLFTLLRNFSLNLLLMFIQSLGIVLVGLVGFRYWGRMK